MGKPGDIDDDATIAAARERGNQSLRQLRAVAARYLPARDRIEIDLTSGWSLQVPRSFSARLASASPADCAAVQVVDSGLGLHWAVIDEDWYVPAVVESLAVTRAA